MPDQNASSHAGFHRHGDNDHQDEEYGSFEVFWDDADPVNGHLRNYDKDGMPIAEGWYWWACFPGCLPDGDINGPFDTSDAAYQDATGE